jgi:hypothetical protein
MHVLDVYLEEFKDVVWKIEMLLECSKNDIILYFINSLDIEHEARKALILLIGEGS